MFLNIPPAIKYTDPWTATLEERLCRLTAAPRRIAYFYEHPDTSTFRYRAFNPGYTLEAQSSFGVSAAWFDHRDLAETDRFVELADALVICRARYNARLARIINRAKQRGIPVIFDCDDLVFDVDLVHTIIETLDLNQRDDAMWHEWFGMVGRIGATLQMCDAFMTTNSYLAARGIEYKSDLRTAVVPNYLNQKQQAVSEAFFSQKEHSDWARDDRIHIGYFSGSPTHAKDFALVAPALARLMARDSRIILRIVGFLSIDGELSAFRDRIEIFPLQDFLNLQRLISEVEINIAPLRENTFTNCKSELKFFEAAICGTLTVASPTFTFASSMDHGRTGYLAPSLRWFDVLRDAVEAVTSQLLYKSIAFAARDYVTQRYSWDCQADTIIGAVFSE